MITEDDLFIIPDNIKLNIAISNLFDDLVVYCKKKAAISPGSGMTHYGIFRSAVALALNKGIVVLSNDYMQQCDICGDSDCNNPRECETGDGA